MVLFQAQDKKKEISSLSTLIYFASNSCYFLSPLFPTLSLVYFVRTFVCLLVDEYVWIWDLPTFRSHNK